MISQQVPHHHGDIFREIRKEGRLLLARRTQRFLNEDGEVDGKRLARQSKVCFWGRHDGDPVELLTGQHRIDGSIVGVGLDSVAGGGVDVADD